MTLVYIAIGLFAFAAVIGIYLLSLVLRNKETRKGLALIHGAAAASALVLLIISAICHEGSRHLVAIILFTVAALGGFVLIARDLSGKKPPKWLAIVHGLTAATALGFLVFK